MPQVHNVTHVPVHSPLRILSTCVYKMDQRRALQHVGTRSVERVRAERIAGGDANVDKMSSVQAHTFSPMRAPQFTDK